MSNIEKRNSAQVETTADRVSDVMIFSGVALFAVPFVAMLLPFITTWMLAVVLIGGGVVLGGAKNFRK